MTLDNTTGNVHPWINRCKDRMCPYCGNARSQKVASQLFNALVHMKDPRMMVLTMRSSDTPLPQQLAHLRNSLAKLRRMPWWKEHVTGGVYTMEITINDSSGLWHPHLHILYDGKYMPQKGLRHRWHLVTGDSDIVWLAKVTDNIGAARELAKYVGKPQKVSQLSLAQIREYASASSGQRMVASFGNLHGVRLHDQDKNPPLPDDVYRVQLSRIVYLATRNHDTPGTLAKLIATRWHQFRSYIHGCLPNLAATQDQAEKLRHVRGIVTGHAPPECGSKRTDLQTSMLDNELRAAFRQFKYEDELGTYSNDGMPCILTTA